MRYIKYFLVFAFFTVLGIIYSREMPKLKTWLLKNIEYLATQKTDFELKAQSLDFTLFPLGIELNKISLNPKDRKIKKELREAKIETLGVSLSTIALLTGRFEIGKVTIGRPTIKLHINNSESEAKEPSKSVEIPWDEIISIPVKKISFKDAEIQAEVDPLKKNISVSRFTINIEKSMTAAKIEIFSPQTQMTSQSNSKENLNLGLATRIIVERQAAEISALKITLGDNLILARGVVRGDLTRLSWATANFRTLTHVKLDEIVGVLKENGVKVPLSQAQGEFNLDSVGSIKKNEPLVAAGDLDAKNIQVNQFNIGNIRSRIKFNKDVVNTDKLTIHNSAGDISIKDFTLDLKDEPRFTSRVQTQNLELSSFLVNLGLTKTPLHLETFLNSSCEGTLSANYKVRCAGDVTGKNFKVVSVNGTTEKTIVALKEFKITSHFNLENNNIIFPEGEMQVGNSQGRVSGNVHFKEGFKFNFETESLDFKDITNLADLKFEGALALKGSTQGDSHAATFNSETKAKDFWFEDYHLGNGQMDLSYEKANLDLKNINMSFAHSTYSGTMRIALAGDMNMLAQIKFPKLSITELKEAFSRKSKLDFNFEGQGAAELTAQGPPSLSKLNYTLTSKFEQGIVYNESFQNLVFNVHANQGHVYADQIQIKKGDGSAILTGDISSQGNMSLFVKGKDFHLSDFEHVRNIINGVDGRLQFDLSLQDKILDPKISLRGLVTQSTINQEPLADSSFSVDYGPENVTFITELFARKIFFKMNESKKGKQISSYKFETENWDFSPFLSAFSGADFKKDYETDLTASVSLSSQNNSFLDSTGEIKIPRLFIRHGNYQMQNATPLQIKFNEGQIHLDNLKLKGDNTELSISGTRNKNDNLNISIQGNLELSLISFFTPFFKEMRGVLNINSQVAGTLSKPEFLGSALLNRTYIKFREFPHGFDDISADLLFSQSRIAINKLKGSFASGDLEASGNIQVKGLHEIPVDVTAQISNGTFNVPQGLTTKGSAQVRVTGNWFPYLIQADYNIENGLYTKNFDEQEASVQLKRSDYLPTGIQQKESSSIRLALNAHFPKGVTVKNNLVETDVKGDLEIKGDPKHVILKGEVDAVPGGKMDFRETPFTINVAKIKFNNPTENNPSIYAVGTTRLKEWDITLLYQGNLNKHEIKLSSSPPLSDKSIISLLALGMTEESIEKNKSTDQLAMQATQAGSVLFSQNPLVKEVKKKSGFSFKLSQTVDDARSLARTKIVVEKQWTPKFSTSVGQALNSSSTQDISAEYKINKNFSVLGQYEKRDYDLLTGSNTSSTGSTTTTGNSQQSQATNVLGINLQYQVEFK